MYIQVFGSSDRTLPAGWGDETSLSVFSSSRIDATAVPQEGAKLTIITLLCRTTVLVPAGSRVQLSGGDVLGSHAVDVESSPDGPLIMIQAIPVLGSIRIRSD